MISKDDFEKLGEVLLGKIRAAADDGTLKRALFFFDIARSWAQLDNSTSVKAWLAAGMIESAEFMAKVGLGLVGVSSGADERRYTMRETPEPELYELQVIVDAGKMHLKRTDLRKDQRNLIAEVVRGSEELLKG